MDNNQNNKNNNKKNVSPFNASSYRPSCIYLNPNTSASLKQVGCDDCVACDCILLFSPADSDADDCKLGRNTPSLALRLNDERRDVMVGMSWKELVDPMQMMDKRTEWICIVILFVL